MKIEFKDYNGVAPLIDSPPNTHWRDVTATIENLTLHLKASDQEGIAGTPIFDPKGTNSALKLALKDLGWSTDVAIPDDFQFLGETVDYEKSGVILEAQFSNYPFLLNNVARTFLFRQLSVRINGNIPRALIVITKAKLFPASNSTLYYEHAIKQMDALQKIDALQLPTRIVSLTEDMGSKVPCVFSGYATARYSRKAQSRKTSLCEVQDTGAARATLRLVDQ